MTEAGRLEIRLSPWNLYLWRSVVNLHWILETITTKIPQSWHLQNVVCFLCCQYYRRYQEFCSDFNFVKKNQNCQILNKILHSSYSYIDSTKKSRPQFGNVRTKSILWLLSREFYFLKIGWQINATNFIKIKDEIQVVLLLSCFLGHSVLSNCKLTET